MNKKLTSVLAVLIAGFLIISTVIYVSAFGFHKPEAVSHAKKEEPKEQKWQFAGPTGTFDRQAAQRGYKVYKEVCSSCHSMNLISFRNLKTLGFSDGEIKSIASSYSYPSVGEDGVVADRKGIPSDHFKAPFESKEAAAAANGGAVPPDLSLMVKAREDGPNYVYSLLNGYGKTADYVCTVFNKDGSCTAYRSATDENRKTYAAEKKNRDDLIKAATEQKKTDPKVVVPAFNKDSEKADMIYQCMPHNRDEEANPKMELEDTQDKNGQRIVGCNRLPEGKYFNWYFPNQVISMPPPIKDGQIEYEDGTKASVPQMANDVVNFLEWTAEPEMELRKRMGIKVIAFLAVFTVFFYIAKIKIWKRVH